MKTGKKESSGGRAGGKAGARHTCPESGGEGCRQAGRRRRGSRRAPRPDSVTQPGVPEAQPDAPRRPCRRDRRGGAAPRGAPLRAALTAASWGRRPAPRPT